MQKRKRTAITMNPSTENSSASASGGRDGPPKGALQPRPNPPAKRLRTRPSGQSDKDKLSSEPCKAQRAVKAKPLASQRPAAASSLPPEIWRSIGQMIPHPQTLKSLVRVSRAFRNIFTPILHARRIINLEYFSRPLNETPLPPYLEYVQDFRVNIYEFKQTGGDYDPERNDEYAAWITRALESTRCLRSFSWRDESFEEEYGPALILRNANLLLVLKGTQTLKHVCIQFGAQFVDDPVAVSRSYVPLRGFRNLTSLELYDFYRDHNYLVKDIAYFLCDSPFLMKLGLGFATERTHDDDEAVYFGGPDREADFLERLCEFYGSICKNGPLALETLRLGSGIYLGEPSNPTNGHYLPKLLTVRSLKVLHVCNGLVNSDLDDEDSFYRPVDWTPFTSEECKSLLQLSVARLEEDVTCWLRQGGNCVQELIVTDHYSFNDQGINQFFNIPLSQLSMLWVREKHPWQQSLYEDSDWSDTDSSISDWDLDSSTSDQSTSESSNSQLSHSDPTQPSPLKPNAPKLDKLVMTVLDRLPDGGSHLTRLCIALDFETQWLHFSSHLEKLIRLTQLRLNAKSWRGGAYPTLASSIWPDTNENTENAEIARRFAHLISSMCLTLQYIMIGHDWAWEVIRPDAEHVGIRTRSKSAISLRELDKDEMLEIELFAISDFAEQGGLLGRKRDRVEKVVGKIHSTRELNAIFAERGLSQLPV